MLLGRFPGLVGDLSAQPDLSGNDFKDLIYREALAAGNRQGIHTRTGSDFDIIYHRLELVIDPGIYFIRGGVTTYFKPKNSTITQVAFDFSDSLVVDSVMYHGAPAVFSQLPGDVLQVDLGPVAAGQLDSVTMYYHGEPVSSGFGAFARDTHAGMPIIWTLSEPYGAKEWWPCKQDLNDKADSLDVFVTCPAQYRAASNGLLVGETQSGSWKTWHWKHRYPIAAYLVAVAVTNYDVYTETAPLSTGNLEILNYVYPESKVQAQNQTPALIPALQLYDSLFIPYPFMNEKYGHAQFGWGGGMEHQTMSFVGGFNYELLVHELAHQWFGDYVTCGSWEDIWLNEGFATYLTGLTYEHLFNGVWWMPWKKITVNLITSDPGGSVWVDDTTSVSRIFNGRLSYRKGAYLLHMLRWVVGDDAFFTGIRNYLQDTSIANGYARTDDLKAHLEQASGKDLTGFFDDWFYGEGYPVYQVIWSQDGDGTLHVTIQQTPSHPSVDFFEMPVPLLAKNATDDTFFVLQDTVNGQSFTLQPGFLVDSLIFDPDLWLAAKSSVLLDVGNLAGEEGFWVWPVPGSGPVHIQVDTGNYITSVSLFDMAGRQVGGFYNLFTDRFDLSLNQYERGMYLVSVGTTQGVFRKKILYLR